MQGYDNFFNMVVSDARETCRLIQDLTFMFPQNCASILMGNDSHASVHGVDTWFFAFSRWFTLVFEFDKVIMSQFILFVDKGYKHIGLKPHFGVEEKDSRLLELIHFDLYEMNGYMVTSIDDATRYYHNQLGKRI
ncbi:hypothetical protein ACJX0J_023977 [Zea mays]